MAPQEACSGGGVPFSFALQRFPNLGWSYKKGRGGGGGDLAWHRKAHILPQSLLYNLAAGTGEGAKGFGVKPQAELSSWDVLLISCVLFVRCRFAACNVSICLQAQGRGHGDLAWHPKMHLPAGTCSTSTSSPGTGTKSQLATCGPCDVLIRLQTPGRGQRTWRGTPRSSSWRWCAPRAPSCCGPRSRRRTGARSPPTSGSWQSMRYLICTPTPSRGILHSLWLGRPPYPQPSRRVGAYLRLTPPL